MKFQIRGRPTLRSSRDRSVHRWQAFWPSCCLAVLILAGCASPEPEIDNRPKFAIEKPLPPSRVLVHEFGVEPGDIPIDAPIGARLASGERISPEQIQMDRKLAADMTEKLITAIRQLGLPVERSQPATTLQAHDVVVRGCFVSMHATNAVKPFTVGLDFDAAELLTMVEPFQVTSLGVRHGLFTASNPTGIIVTSGMRIGDKSSARARLDGWAGKTVDEIAARLKILFQEQGWVN